MNLSPNLIYMFEFVIDDLVVLKKNHCAPQEFPTCAEIQFRSNVITSVCDRNYGSCIPHSKSKYGKRCIFPLESQVTEEDSIFIHVFKKRSDKCKFFMGLGEVKAKPIFDSVNEQFENNNIDWKPIWEEQLKELPRIEDSDKILDDCIDCFDAGNERREQLCPASVVVKTMVPLFNLCNLQTGNIVLLIRLVCQGPSIVASYKYKGSKFVALQPPPSIQRNPFYRKQEDSKDKFSSDCMRYFDSSNVDNMCFGDCADNEHEVECRKLSSKKQKQKIVKKLKQLGFCADVTHPAECESLENNVEQQK